MSYSNPMLKSDKLETVNLNQIDPMASNTTVSYKGVIGKSFILFSILLFSGYFLTPIISNAVNSPFSSLSIIAIITFIIAMVFSFKPNWVLLAPIYAALEGILIFKISILSNAIYPGIVSSAISATLVAFGVMLFAYMNRFIRVTPTFAKILIISSISLAVLYLIQIVAHWFGSDIAITTGSSNLSIGISIFAVIIAALFLALDFKNIEDAVEQKVHQKYEWYLSFGLLVTLIWLYIEILNLLSKLRNRD